MRYSRLARATLVLALAVHGALAAPTSAASGNAAPKYKSAQEILDAAPASAWRDSIRTTRCTWPSRPAAS